MISKGYLRFCNRLQHFLADNEIINILLGNMELLAGDDAIFKGVTKENSPILYSYAKTPHCRKITIFHLRKTLLVSFIKEQYEEVTEYLRYVLFHAAKNGAPAQRLIGEHNKINFDANFILSASSHDVLRKAVTDHIFQQLENERSTLDLIKKINSKLGLDIPDEAIEEVLPYLLIRHIFVHSDGKPNQEFREKYPQFKLNQKKQINVLDLPINKIMNKVKKIIKMIDKGMLEKGFFPEDEIQD